MSDRTEVGPPVWANRPDDGDPDDPRGSNGRQRPPQRRFSPSRLAREIDWDAPFARLAVVHATSVTGEGLLALALAGSLFFRTDPAEGRTKVLLGLLLTMAPFAIVGPLIGPMIDRVRGGHRAVIVTTMALRAAVAVTMVVSMRADSLALFPEAFVMLVAGKTYQVSKAAVVPTTVRDDEALVEANSKLQLLAGVLFPGVGIIGGAALWLGGSAAVAAMVAIVFGFATVLAWRIPAPELAERSSEVRDAGGRELRSTAVVTTAVSMAIIRGIVGFVTFLLAFALRGGDYRLPPDEILARNVAEQLPFLFKGSIRPAEGPPPTWHFGVVLTMSIVGGLVGASVAPRLRRLVAEERILAGALGSVILCALGAAVLGELAGAVVLAFFVAMAAGAAKQAFDAVVQRDAPDADRGRAFARFESQFQIVWVLGALVPTAIPLSIPVGSVVVGAAGAIAALTYTVSLRSPRPPPLTRLRRKVTSGRTPPSGPSNQTSG